MVPRRRLALRPPRCVLLVVLICVGCAEPAAREAPLGAFVLDPIAMSKALIAQGVPAQAARRQAAAGRVRLEFDPEGTFELVVRSEAGTERWSGRWSRAGAQVTLTTQASNVAAAEEKWVVQARLQGELLHVRPPGGALTPFILRRE